MLSGSSIIANLISSVMIIASVKSGLLEFLSRGDDLPMSDANGFTTRLVPITISKSAFGKSVCALLKKFAGRFSPARSRHSQPAKGNRPSLNVAVTCLPIAKCFSCTNTHCIL